MKSLTRWSAAAALLLAVQACAPATSGISSSPSAPLQERTVISAEEVAALRLPDLHSVVRTLHPEWLRVEGEIGVFVHGARRGDAQALAALPAADRVQVRFLDAAALAREGARLDASGLAAAILVEAPARVTAQSITGLPPEMHLTLAMYGVYPVTKTTDPFAYDEENVLLSESEHEEIGFTVAPRLSYRGIYVQPFYLTGSEYGVVYQRRTSVRNLDRTIDPHVGVIAGYEYGPIRAGIGVMTETSSWRWSIGECKCTSVGEDKTDDVVPVAEVAARARLWRVIGAELRVSGSQRPAIDRRIEQFYPEIYLRQEKATVVDVSFGLSARLF